MDLTEFIDIIDYEGLYKINKNGEIWSCYTNKILKPNLTKKGYYYINLCKNNQRKYYRLHRLVALNFIPNDDETKIQIDHIDGNRTNNNIENLRWVTPKENTRNVVSKSNCIYETIRKDRNNVLTYRARFPVYIDGNLTYKQNQSIHRYKVEEWVEKMKKEYPNPYTGGRIC